MQSLKMVPACICFLSLLISITTAAPDLPRSLFGESNELEDSLNKQGDSLNEQGDSLLSETIYNVQYSIQSKQEIQEIQETKEQEEFRQKKYVQEGIHNLTLGEKTDQDKILSYQYIDHPSISTVDKIIYKNVSYPLTVNITNDFTISYLEAYDQHSNGSEAGYVSLILGGVGKQNVLLFLESKRNAGLIYLVRVWGH